MNRGAVSALIALGRQPGLRSPGRSGVPQGARQGPAHHLVRRSARRDQRPRSRALPRSPFPRIVGRRGAGERALQPRAAADRAAARHPRRRREPAGVGSVAGRAADHRSYLRDFWRRALYPRAATAAGFDDFWERTLERGVVDLPGPAAQTHAFAGDWQGAVRDIARAPAGAGAAPRRLRAGAARDRRRARRPPRQQPVAARAARSDHAPHLGQRRVDRARDRRGAGRRAPATSSR